MEEKVLIQVKHLHKLEDLKLKLMNHDMINIGETTHFSTLENLLKQNIETR